MLSIILRSGTKGVFEANGQVIGVVGPDENEVLLRCSPNQNILLTFLPFDGAGIPLHWLIEVRDGAIRVPEDGFNALSVDIWPYGIAEIYVPAIFAGENARPFPKLLAKLDTDDGTAAEIFGDGGCFLSAERSGRTDYFELPAGLARPVIEYRDITGAGPFIIVRGETDSGEYLGIYGECAEGFSELLSKTADHVYLPEETPCSIGFLDILQDVAGHAAYQAWNWDGKKYVLGAASIEWADGHPRRPGSEREAAEAFLQAIALGCGDEAAERLAPAARERLSYEDLRAAIGPIDDILEVKYPVNGVYRGLLMAVAEDIAAGCRRIRIFSMEMDENGLLMNISEIK